MRRDVHEVQAVPNNSEGIEGVSLISQANTSDGKTSVAVRIRDLAHQRRQIDWWMQLMKLTVVVIVWTLLCGLVDYGMRWNGAQGRLLISIGWFAGMFAAGWLLLKKKTLWSMQSPVSLARDIEANLGLQRGYLSSIVDLETNQRATRGLSPSLIERAIREGEEILKKVPFKDGLPSQPLKQWLTVLGLCFLLTCSACFVVGSSMATSLQRLSMPWRSVAWPRAVQLEFVGLPSVISQGSVLNIRVVNRKGEIPKRVDLYARGEGFDKEVPLSMELASNQAHFNLSPSSDIEIRSSGGDDDQMPWQRIQVMKAPIIERVTFHIEPPEYTGLAAQTISGQTVQVVRGTKIRFEGTLSSEVESIELQRMNWVSETTIQPNDPRFSRPPAYSVSPESKVEASNNSEIEASSFPGRLRLLKDRRSFVLEGVKTDDVVAAESFQFGLRWISQGNLINESDKQWEVQVQSDASPIVEWKEPDANYSANARAAIPIEYLVTDDYGVERINFHWEWRDNQSSRVTTGEFPLVRNGSPSLIGFSLPANQTLGKEWSDSGNWSPSQLVALQAEDTLEIWIAAKDGSGQVGMSERRKLKIQSDATLLQEQLVLQNRIVDRLRRALEHEQGAHSQFSKIDNDAEDASPNIQFLQQSMDRHDQCAEAIAGKDDSAVALIDQAVKNWTRSGFDTGLSARDLQQIGRSLRRLQSEEVEEIQQLFQQMQQMLLAKDHPSIQEPRTTALNHLETVEKALEEWIAALGGKLKPQDVKLQIQSIAERERALADRSETLARKSLDSSQSSQVARERGEIIKEQNELIGAMDALQADLSKEIREMQRTSDQKEVLEEMIKLSKTLSESQASSDMRRAAGLLQDQQFSQAAQLQSRISNRLAGAAALNGAKERDNGNSGSEVQQVVEKIYREQLSIAEELEKRKELKSPSDEEAWELKDLMRRQTSLREQIPSTFEKNARAFQWAGRMVEGEMRKVEASLERTQTSIAWKHAKTASERLASILESLAPKKNGKDEREKSEPGEEETEKKEKGQGGMTLESLMLLRDIQESLQERTTEIEAEVVDGKLSPQQWIESNELAHQQQELAEQIQELIKAIVPSEGAKQ